MIRLDKDGTLDWDDIRDDETRGAPVFVMSRPKETATVDEFLAHPFMESWPTVETRYELRPLFWDMGDRSYLRLDVYVEEGTPPSVETELGNLIHALHQPGRTPREEFQAWLRRYMDRNSRRDSPDQAARQIRQAAADHCVSWEEAVADLYAYGFRP